MSQMDESLIEASPPKKSYKFYLILPFQNFFQGLVEEKWVENS